MLCTVFIVFAIYFDFDCKKNIYVAVVSVSMDVYHHNAGYYATRPRKKKTRATV